MLVTAFALLGGTVARGQETYTPPLTKAEKKKAAKEAKQAAKEAKAAKGRNYAANPTKVKFGEFKAVEIKATEITEKQYQKPGNEKSAAKIDEMLQTQLKYIFPNLKVIPAGGEFSKGNERTLQNNSVHHTDSHCFHRHPRLAGRHGGRLGSGHAC